jgi:peroxiredoxin
VLFGVPDRGSVCSEQHFPGYVREWDKLRAAGVSRVICVTCGTPAEAADWASKLQVEGGKVEVAADANQGFTRFLGMELTPPGQPGPSSMRWAALVVDGILLKVVRACSRATALLPLLLLRWWRWRCGAAAAVGCTRRPELGLD